jgi:hypothetical protein
MVWVFVVCAAIFVVGIVTWVVKDRETIRRYRDHLEAAHEEAERDDRHAK